MTPETMVTSKFHFGKKKKEKNSFVELYAGVATLVLAFPFESKRLCHVLRISTSKFHFFAELYASVATLVLLSLRF